MPNIKHTDNQLHVSVLNTPTLTDAATPDSLVAQLDGIAPDIPLHDVVSYVRTAHAAGTVSQKDYDFSGITVSDKAYTVTISHDGEERTYSFWADSSTHSKSDIVTGLKDAIEADPEAVVEDNSTSGTDLKIKLKNDADILKGGDFTAEFSDSNVTETVSVAFVAPEGTFAIVEDFDSAGATSGNEYTTYEIVFRNHKRSNYLSGDLVKNLNRVIVFANEGAAGYSDFDGRMGSLFDEAGYSPDQKLYSNTFHRVDTEWTLEKAGFAQLPASQTGKVLNVPIEGLKEGDEITAFTVHGFVTDASNNVALDGRLRKVTGKTASTIDSIATVAPNSNTAFSEDKALSSPEVVAADNGYFVEIDGTTDTGDEIQIAGVEVTVNRK